MCKVNKFLLSVVAFLMVSFSNVSFAGEIDILVEKLVEKGILTPDSDAMGGGTDMKGHEAILAYGLGENTSLGFDYYYMSDIGDNDKHHIFQVDWKLKF